MIQFEKQNLETTFKETYNKVKSLKRKTKEMIAIGLTVFALGSFVVYDATTGVAYAAGSGEGTPYSIMAGEQEIAVVQSRGDAELVVENLKGAYGKTDATATAIVTPAITIEEKEYVTAESVDIVDAQEATYAILQENNDGDPIFKVVVKQPLVKTQPIAYNTTIQKRGDLDKGVTSVKTNGVNGSKIVIGEQTVVNGEVIDSTVYSEKITAQPVTAVIYEGTKEEVKVTTTATSTSKGSTKVKTKARTYNASTSMGVLGYAQAFHGVPYVSGGATPSGFDCSGFTMYVYRAFGISLPHSSSGQANMGVAVSASEARPGDLVVMPGHVGIYAGNGMITHSPAPGQSVKTQRLWTKASFRRLV